MFYIKLIYFSFFGKKVILNDDEVQSLAKTKDDSESIYEEDKIIISDNDDIPNILL